tara:strand:+ start:1605 stop:2330 length:726 start_codon:yes stop_codon:yes gene_type:complete
MAGPIAVIGAIAAGVGALTSAGVGIGGKISANKQARIQEAKARKMQQRLEAFEASRQGVLNQAEDIRALKSQVFNPYANIGVANQASELKIQQTDEALANTLDQINRSGTGAGAATALAKMAATSKAQVGASLENQEVKNQQLRMQGEASMISQKLQLEQAALGEEGAAWGRQENRDLATLDRLSGLGENAQAQQMAYQQGGDAMLMSGMQGFAQGMGSMGGAMMGMESGGNNNVDPNDIT